MASSDSQVAEAIAALDSLPASVNRYTAAAEMLLAERVTLPLVGAPLVLVCVMISMYCVMFLTGLVYFYVKRPFRIANWCTTDLGLLRPNASNLLVLFNLCFAALTIGSFSLQIWLTQQDRMAHWGPWWSLAGIRYIPLFLAGWCYTWGMVVSCVVSSRSMLRDHPRDWASPPGVEKKLRERRRFLWEAILLNSIGIAVPVGQILSQLIFFIPVSIYSEAMRAALANCIALLQAAAPSYDPETFGPVLLIPPLAPLPSAVANAANMVASFARGWRACLFFMFLLLAVFTPAAFVHLRLLARLRAARAVISARPSEQSLPRSRWSVHFRALNEYNTLRVTVLLVYLVTLIHVPFAIWAVIRTESNSEPDIDADLLVVLVLIVPPLSWGIIGNVVHAAFLLQHTWSHASQHLQRSGSHIPSVLNSNTDGMPTQLNHIRIIKESSDADCIPTQHDNHVRTIKKNIVSFERMELTGAKHPSEACVRFDDVSTSSK